MIKTLQVLIINSKFHSRLNKKKIKKIKDRTEID